MTEKEKEAEIINLRSNLAHVTRQRDLLFQENGGWRKRYVATLAVAIICCIVAITNAVLICKLVAATP